MNSSIFLTCIANVATEAPPAGDNWLLHYAMDNVAEPSYSAPFGSASTETAETSGTWDAGSDDFIRVMQVSGATESDGGLNYITGAGGNINSIQASLDATEDKAFGWVMRIGTTFAANAGGRLKNWWIEADPDRDDGPQVNTAKHSDGVHVLPILGWGGTHYPTTDGTVTYGEAGSETPLGRTILDQVADNYPFIMNDLTGEWLYGEIRMQSEAVAGTTNGTCNFKVYRRTSATPILDWDLDIDAAGAAPGTPQNVATGTNFYNCRLSAYVQDAYGTADANSYIDYSDVYFKDMTQHTEGPPTGFVI